MLFRSQHDMKCVTETQTKSKIVTNSLVDSNSRLAGYSIFNILKVSLFLMTIVDYSGREPELLSVALLWHVRTVGHGSGLESCPWHLFRRNTVLFIYSSKQKGWKSKILQPNCSPCHLRTGRRNLPDHYTYICLRFAFIDRLGLYLKCRSTTQLYGENRCISVPNNHIVFQQPYLIVLQHA